MGAASTIIACLFFCNYSILLYCTILHCTILHYNVLYYNVLYYTVLYCTVQVLFCRLTEYQRGLYEEYVNGPEVQAMLSGRRWVRHPLITINNQFATPIYIELEI